MTEELEANLLDLGYGMEPGKKAGWVCYDPGWGMLVEGTGKLPSSLIILGVIVSLSSLSAISISISLWKPSYL